MSMRWESYDNQGSIDEKQTLLQSDKPSEESTRDLKASDEKKEQQPKEKLIDHTQLYGVLVGGLLEEFHRSELPRELKDDLHLYQIIKKLSFDPVPVYRFKKEEEKALPEPTEDYFPEIKDAKTVSTIKKEGEEKSIPRQQKNEVDLAEFTEKFQQLLLYQSQFEAICEANGISDSKDPQGVMNWRVRRRLKQHREKQKEAIKLYFENVKLYMMTTFYLMLLRKDIEDEKSDAEVRSFIQKFLFNTTAGSVLIVEAMEGMIGGSVLVPGQVIPALIIGTVCAMFTAGMHYTTDIVPQLDGDKKPQILPGDQVYRAQLKALQQINTFLQRKTDLEIDYASVAKMMHDDVIKRKQEFPPKPETRGQKFKRYFAAGVSAGVRGAFVYFTVGEFVSLVLLAIGITVLTGGWALAVMGLGVALSVLVAGFTFKQMKKNFKTELNPQIEERDKTLEAIHEYEDNNAELNHTLNDHIMRPVNQKLQELTNQITLEKKFITDLKDNDEVGSHFTTRISNQIQRFKKELNELKESCKTLDPAEKEFKDLSSRFKAVEELIKELEDLNTNLEKRDKQLKAKRELLEKEKIREALEKSLKATKAAKQAAKAAKEAAAVVESLGVPLPSKKEVQDNSSHSSSPTGSILSISSEDGEDESPIHTPEVSEVHIQTKKPEQYARHQLNIKVPPRRGPMNGFGVFPLSAPCRENVFDDPHHLGSHRHIQAVF